MRVSDGVVALHLPKPATPSQGKRPGLEPMNSTSETLIVPQITDTQDGVELSVVMPCLNERATVGLCVNNALENALRIVIPGVVFFTLGFQTVLSSFFLSVLGMARR